MTSKDLIHLEFGPYRCFSIRYYGSGGVHYGFRNLSPSDKGFPQRFSIDVWKLGFIFENYNYSGRPSPLNLKEL